MIFSTWFSEVLIENTQYLVGRTLQIHSIKQLRAKIKPMSPPSAIFKNSQIMNDPNASVGTPNKLAWVFNFVLCKHEKSSCLSQSNVHGLKKNADRFLATCSDNFTAPLSSALCRFIICIVRSYYHNKCIQSLRISEKFASSLFMVHSFCNYLAEPTTWDVTHRQ